jgi:conjugal transfer/entry exclusion protein
MRHIMTIKRYALTICLILGVALPAQRTNAFVAPVIDIANLAQNIQNVIYQWKQITEMVRQYQVLYEHYKDTVENLKHADPRGLLLGYLMGRDARLGGSALGGAQYLDPNGPQWRQNMETLLRSHYHLLDKVDAAVAASQAFDGGSAYERAMRFFERRDAEMTPLLDAYHFQATQEHAAEDRQRQLERLKQSFSGLSDRSALRQQQHANGLLAIQAQQNEAIIDSQHMLMSILVQEQIQRQSTLDRANEAEIRRLVRERTRPVYTCPQGGCFPVW